MHFGYTKTRNKLHMLVVDRNNPRFCIKTNVGFVNPYTFILINVF